MMRRICHYKLRHYNGGNEVILVLLNNGREYVHIIVNYIHIHTHTYVYVYRIT